MRKRNLLPESMLKNAKSGGLDEACARYGLGRPSMRKVAADAEAIVRIGKRVIIVYSKVDDYLDAAAGK